MNVAVRRWAAWAPGLHTRQDWERWAGAPVPLGDEGGPDGAFLPAMLRRRCSRLTRLMLHVAHEAAGPGERAALPAIFASRHGEAGITAGLLESLAREQAVTATAFSHSVHNTQAGLFSIAAGSRQIASALAAGADTFPSAFVEALAVLHRHRGGAVLLVAGDEPLPDVWRPLVDEPCAVYAVALVLERCAEAEGLRLAPGPADRPAPPRPWPAAVEFLRWLLSGEAALTLNTGQRFWTWTRPAGLTGPATAGRSARC